MTVHQKLVITGVIDGTQGDYPPLASGHAPEFALSDCFVILHCFVLLYPYFYTLYISLYLDCTLLRQLFGIGSSGLTFILYNK